MAETLSLKIAMTVCSSLDLDQAVEEQTGSWNGERSESWARLREHNFVVLACIACGATEQSQDCPPMIVPGQLDCSMSD